MVRNIDDGDFSIPGKRVSQLFPSRKSQILTHIPQPGSPQATPKKVKKAKTTGKWSYIPALNPLSWFPLVFRFTAEERHRYAASGIEEVFEAEGKFDRPGKL